MASKPRCGMCGGPTGWNDICSACELEMYQVEQAERAQESRDLGDYDPPPPDDSWVSDFNCEQRR